MSTTAGRAKKRQQLPAELAEQVELINEWNQLRDDLDTGDENLLRHLNTLIDQLAEQLDRARTLHTRAAEIASRYAALTNKTTAAGHLGVRPRDLPTSMPPTASTAFESPAP